MNKNEVLKELPSGAQDRKNLPVASGALDYFPAAIAEISKISKMGNDQHNPGQPLHWAREKSGDHADCLIRHFIQRGTKDSDGARHTAKMAWRALALLQEELEAEAGYVPPAKQKATQIGGIAGQNPIQILDEYARVAKGLR